jgi:hypothetical protein
MDECESLNRPDSLVTPFHLAKCGVLLVSNPATSLLAQFFMSRHQLVRVVTCKPHPDSGLALAAMFRESPPRSGNVMIFRPSEPLAWGCPRHELEAFTGELVLIIWP